MVLVPAGGVVCRVVVVGVVVCGVVVVSVVVGGFGVGEGSEFESLPGMRTAIRTITSRRQKTPMTLKIFEVLQHAKVEY